MHGWRVPGYTEMKGIGSGGFGEVTLARHDATGTLVAIKYLHSDLLADSEFAEMFRGEASMLASLADPNIVRLYEYVESRSGAAIVMELIGGVSLREVLTYQGKTSAEAALVVLRGSLLGLAAAHQHGIVHRDYKPENVLVSGDGVSKLTDFGIAARAGDRPVPAGTLRYAAPEQMAGAPASPASDIYAATATFYECLTGRPPFNGAGDELLRQHRLEPVPLDQVSEALRPLVSAGMAKDPRGRPADATTFVADLQTAAVGACGQDWEARGRSHLGEAALLLAALWPSGAPPTVQGTSVYQVPLRKRPRPRHIGPVQGAVAAGAAVAAVAAGFALAAVGTQRPTAANPAAAVRSVSLQPLPSPSAVSPAPSPPQTGSGRISPLPTPGPPTTIAPTTQKQQTTQLPPSTQRPPTTQPPPRTQPPPTTQPAPQTVPGVPSVTATANGSYQITVQWTDPSPGITGFYIDNGCPAGACGQADVEEYKTLGLAYSTTFAATPGDYECYLVLAISSAGRSAYSSWACLTTPGLTLSGATQWLDTGVSLAAGDGVGIRASGTIYIVASGNPVGPDGEDCTVDTNRADLQAPCYSLIGRIGTGAPFEIGSADQVVATAGELYIGVNDDNFGDNSGSWSVRIKRGGSLPP